MTDSSTAEKGGAAADGVRLLLCENPLPPIDEAIAAATNEVPHSNHYRWNRRNTTAFRPWIRAVTQ